MPSPSANNPDKTTSSAPASERAKEASNQATIALELPFVLVSAILVGGLLGFFLDRWLHTKPVFMLIFGGIGFFAGVRDVLRRLPGGGDGTKRG